MEFALARRNAFWVVSDAIAVAGRTISKLP